jgi:hypothetical protein
MTKALAGDLHAFRALRVLRAISGQYRARSKAGLFGARVGECSAPDATVDVLDAEVIAMMAKGQCLGRGCGPLVQRRARDRCPRTLPRWFAGEPLIVKIE